MVRRGGSRSPRREVRTRRSSQKWDAGLQTLKRKAEARGKRNTGGARLQAALQTAGHTAARRAGGGRDAGADQAAALLMAPEGKEVAVVPGAEGNPIEFKGLGQKAEPEGPGQGLVHAHIVEAVKDPVTEEPVAGPGTETDVKSGTKRKEKRRRIKAKTKKCTASNAGILETSKLD